jgi:hypothetical protein
MDRPSKRDTALRKEMLAQKEELRKRIECDLQLKKDFAFLIEKTGLQPQQLITGLWLDCNLKSADRQTLLRNQKMELWPISEDTLRRDIKNIRRMARQIQAINQTKDLSPTRDQNIGHNFVALPEMLRLYARELERRVNIWALYWKQKRSRIPGIVLLTREHSVYERVRSSAGQYHQARLLRLLNVAREILGHRRISQRAFTMWLNRFEKQRTQKS